MGAGEICKTKNECKGGYISSTPSLFAPDYRPTTCMCKVIHTIEIFTIELISPILGQVNIILESYSSDELPHITWLLVW